VSGREPTERLQSPREFCGRFPWPLISELKDGDEIVACFVVREARKLLTKTNQPYLRLVLADRTGTIEAVAWEDVDRFEPVCTPTAIVGARGRISMYQDRPQLRILSLEPVEPAPGDMEHLLAASKRDRDLMERELDAHIASVRDRPLRGLLRRCLGRDTELGRAFRVHPAATRNHHAYLYGLLEHSLSVAGTCDRLAEHYRDQGIRVDRDLLIAGALLHDIGKIEELEAPPAAAYSTPGRLLGHIVLGIQIVAREGKSAGMEPERLLLLQHLVASHQGKPEWDSPKVPQLVEGLILHYADDLDAKVNQAATALAAVEAGCWSAYERTLGRSFYQPGSNTAGDRPGGGEGSDSIIDLFRS
jgi:3'-5' exoribonuclease